MKTRVVVIDDEQPARDLVKIFLQDYPDYEVVGEAENGFQGVKVIGDQKPDLVFLDIQMPKLDGFEMLELVSDPPMVIFCTAYDQYALKAFEHKALDYLLKPFNKERFREALQKIKGPLNEKILPELSGTYHTMLERIAVKTGDKIDIIPVDKVTYLESQDDYVEIHSEGKKYLKNQRMKYFESALDARFVRIHRRYILNVKELNKLEKFGKETHVAILKNGERLTVSAAGYTRLREALNL